jgi:hypothetical protein
LVKEGISWLPQPPRVHAEANQRATRYACRPKCGFFLLKDDFSSRLAGCCSFKPIDTRGLKDEIKRVQARKQAEVDMKGAGRMERTSGFTLCDSRT